MKKTAKTIFSSFKFYMALLFLSLMAYFNFLSSSCIYKYFPNRVIIDDLLFRLTPYVSWTQYWTDIANLFSCILLLIYLFYGRSRQFAYILTTFAVMYLMRGFLILLNPLGGPLGNGVHYGLTQIHQYGQFPSGHTGIVILCYLLVDGKEAPIIKKVLLVSVIVEIVSLILSRGHYSIDIVGGFFIAYLAVNIMQRYKQKLMIN